MKANKRLIALDIQEDTRPIFSLSEDQYIEWVDSNDYMKGVIVKQADKRLKINWDYHIEEQATREWVVDRAAIRQAERDEWVQARNRAFNLVEHIPLEMVEERIVSGGFNEEARYHMTGYTMDQVKQANIWQVR